MKKDDLDYYLAQDHAARQRTMVISVITGALAGATAELAKVPAQGAFGICVLTVIVIEFAGALGYGKVAERSRQAAVIFPVRRYLIRAALPAISIFVLAFLGIPNIEAAVVQRRLREMTGEDPLPFEKVDALINLAIQYQIPIPERSIAAAQRRVLAAAKVSEPTVPTPASATFARLEAYTLFKVTAVRLHLSTAVLLPPETLTIHGPVYAFSSSVLGQSRNVTVIDVAFKRTEAMAAVINYGLQMQSDALVAHMAATGRTLAPAETPQFIRKLAESEGYKVAALDLRISNLRQTLDELIWIDVVFEHCLIAYAGGAIRLEGVVFLDCEFSASSQAGEKVLEYIRSYEGSPVTLNR
jgi:hypothetical protein